MTGCPLLERMGNWICCRPKLSAMDWDEKTLKDLHGSLPKEAIHQVRKNDGKFMETPKKLGGWITDRPTCFLVWPSQFLFSRLHCFFQEEDMVKRSYILGCSSPSQSHPTNVSPHPSFRGLRSKAADHWTWYCSNSKELIFRKLFQHISFKEHTL